MSYYISLQTWTNKRLLNILYIYLVSFVCVFLVLGIGNHFVLSMFYCTVFVSSWIQLCNERCFTLCRRDSKEGSPGPPVYGHLSTSSLSPPQRGHTHRGGDKIFLNSQTWIQRSVCFSGVCSSVKCRTIQKKGTIYRFPGDLFCLQCGFNPCCFTDLSNRLLHCISKTVCL